MAWKLRTAVAAVAFVALALPAYSFPVNYVSAKLGASVSTPAKTWGNEDPNKILSDGTVSKGEFSFADVQQQNVLIIDLGQKRTFDRIDFGSDNEGGSRSPASLKIEVASSAPDGPYKTVLVKTPIAWFQVIRLPKVVKARWVTFDMGERSTGAAVRAVRIYKGYEHPKLVEVTRLLREKIKPGLPGLEKFYAASDAGNWKLACKELRANFALTHKRDGPPDPKYDLTRAKTYASGQLDFAGFSRQEVVPIDWSYQKTTDWYEHKNFLNRGSPIGAPAAAYYNTGSKFWARQFRSVFYDWIEANPKPTVMSRADYPSWRTLDSAARLAYLQVSLPRVTVGKDIDDELWANVLFSIWEHVDYLKDDTFDGGNWLATVSGSVMGAALEFPEFADQKIWLAFGKTSFELNVERDIWPDGKEKEDAPGYVSMAYQGMLATLGALDKAKIEVSADSRDRMSKTQDFLVAVTQPNGLTPYIGDWGGDPPWALPAAYDFYKKDYVKYILTQGKEGAPPAFTSINFPDGGWSMMRSPYDEKPYENARHLVFKSSCASHGHLDVLNITAYAYGRPLIIDPGIRSYEGADVERYIQTAYHNTICVDGKTQSRGAGKTEFWKSDDTLDYVYASHQDYKGLTVRRSVIFVKPDYWIVHDDITGDGSHTYDQNWHFDDDAAIAEDPLTKAVHTSYATGGNLLVVPADPSSLKSEVFDFFIAKERMGQTGTGNIPSKGWKYSKEGTAPQSFDVVLYPYSGPETPRVSVRRLHVKDASPTEATALEVTVGGKRDIVLFSRVGPRVMKVQESDVNVTGSGDIVLLRGQSTL
jgi:hypothetical protein